MKPQVARCERGSALLRIGRQDPEAKDGSGALLLERIHVLGPVTVACDLDKTFHPLALLKKRVRNS